MRQNSKTITTLKGKVSLETKGDFLEEVKEKSAG